MLEAVPVQRGHADCASGLDSIRQPTFWTLQDGAQVEIRPIRPEDEEHMIKFHRGLSERSIYMRYFESLSFATRSSHARLTQVCRAVPDCQTVLIALPIGPQSLEQRIAAVGRLSKLADPSKAEVALLVLDEFQQRGLGTELLRQLIDAALEQKVTQIEAEMLRDNTSMQRVLKKLGFRLRLLDPRSVRAVLRVEDGNRSGHGDGFP